MTNNNYDYMTSNDLEMALTDAYNTYLFGLSKDDDIEVIVEKILNK